VVHGGAALITLNDLYSFDPNHIVDPAKFSNIIGRHFKQPKEGLGNDNSPTAHMWRTIANPDAPSEGRIQPCRSTPDVGRRKDEAARKRVAL
jgi:hypothetical protein